jgi:hypothetical protein
VVFNAEAKPEDKLLSQPSVWNKMQPKPEWCHMINKKDHRQSSE